MPPSWRSRAGCTAAYAALCRTCNPNHDPDSNPTCRYNPKEMQDEDGEDDVDGENEENHHHHHQQHSNGSDGPGADGAKNRIFSANSADADGNVVLELPEGFNPLLRRGSHSLGDIHAMMVAHEALSFDAYSGANPFPVGHLSAPWILPPKRRLCHAMTCSNVTGLVTSARCSSLPSNRPTLATGCRGCHHSNLPGSVPSAKVLFSVPWGLSPNVRPCQTLHVADHPFDVRCSCLWVMVRWLMVPCTLQNQGLLLLLVHNVAGVED
jgi:hypothetical protein